MSDGAFDRVRMWESGIEWFEAEWCKVRAGENVRN